MNTILTQKERARLYYQEHKEEIKARVREYDRNNKEKVSAAHKKYAEEHAEELKEYRRLYFLRNREKKREQGRLWREKNPDKVFKYSNNWKSTHHEEVMEHWRRRRAIQKGVEGGHFTGKEFMELCQATGNKCLCCGAKNVKLTADHVIPIGPPHSDEISNIQPLCSSCNCKKFTKTVDYR